MEAARAKPERADELARHAAEAEWERSTAEAAESSAPVRLVPRDVKSVLKQQAAALADTDCAADVRAEALGLLTQLWLLYPQHIDARAENVRQLLSILKKGADSGPVTLQLYAHSCLFHLLKEFDMAIVF